MSKIAVLYGVDNGVLMPACMLLNDIAAFIVGVAIVKDRLLGITVVVKKTTVYSLLAALAVFVFSVSEHLLATYVGSILGEPSAYAHVISVAVVIAAIMPVRRRLKSAIDLFFARRSVSF